MFFKLKDENQDFTKYLISLQKVSEITLLQFFIYLTFKGLEYDENLTESGRVVTDKLTGP